MDYTETGGPAFPRPASEFTGQGTCPDGNDAVNAQDGMTLRDWFAGQAIGGLVNIQPPDRAMSWDETIEWLSKVAYKFADAMLEARRK